MEPSAPQPAKSEMNVYGLIGLILSIVGFITIVTAPVGLVLSFMGLKHPEKGLAIAGVVVGIVSTLYAAGIALLLLFYFGTIGACCCAVGFAAWQQEAQEDAARNAVAPALNRPVEEVRIESLTGGGTSGQPSQASGTAVYTDETGTDTAQDFTCMLRKVDNEWEAYEVQLQGEPYEWIEPEEFEEDVGEESLE